MNSESISVLIITIIVVILSVVIVVVLLRSSSNAVTTGSTINTGTVALPSLGQLCTYTPGNTNLNDLGSTGICAAGLICAQSGICIADIGTPCIDYSQCTSLANVCSGKCANGVTNVLEGFCPCLSSDLVCVTQSDGYNRCVLVNGESCTSSNQCLNQCINGICQGFLGLGAACINNNQCASGLSCSSGGNCQPAGVQNGQQNAFCDSKLPCDSPLFCANNECVSTFSVFGTNCTNSLCNLPLTCVAQPPVPPSSTTYNICTFPYNNAANFVCIQNFTDVGGTCLANTNQSCFTNLNCTSGTCHPNNSLLYWNGTYWQGAVTTPTDVYSRVIVLYRTGSTQANVYLVGAGGIRYYNATSSAWSTIVTNPTPLGIIIDACIDSNNNLFYLIDTASPKGHIVTDSTFIPVSNFGTLDGNLIVGGSPVPLISIDIDINDNIISNDTSGVLYINATSQGNLGATKARAFGNYTPATNYAYINNGVKTFGQLNNNTFPLFQINSQTYNKIADYSIHVENSTSVPTSVSATASNILMIASPDNVNYQIILNSGAYQSSLPGYVNYQSLIGTNGTDIYLFNPNICE